MFFIHYGMSHAQRFVELRLEKNKTIASVLKSKKKLAQTVNKNP